HLHRISWHSFGAASGNDRIIFDGGNDADTQLALYGSTQGAMLGYLVSTFRDPYLVDFYVHDPSVDAAPKVIVSRLPAVFCPLLLGERLVVFTDWGAPNGRVVTIDLNEPQPDMWRDL